MDSGIPVSTRATETGMHIGGIAGMRGGSGLDGLAVGFKQFLPIAPFLYVTQGIGQGIQHAE